MAKIVDQLRALKIYNTHNLLTAFAAKGRDVAITFTPHSRQTMTTFGVRLMCPRGVFKNVPHFSSGMIEGREQAKAYCAERFGITEWVACPTERTTLIPREVKEAALTAIKAASL
jgi:hypothetical protein